MVTIDAVARLVLALPEGLHHGHRTWQVAGHDIAWVRPFSKADIKRFAGKPVPSGPIVAVRVLDLDDRAAMLAPGHQGLFTIPHLDNYPALLVDLDTVESAVLAETLVDGWLACAPETLAREYLKSSGGGL